MSIEGGCSCGAVRYRVELGERPPVYVCHCTNCQTHTGSACAVQMPIFAALLKVEGELRTGENVLPSGAIGTIHVCVKCGVRIYAENSSRPGLVIVRAGTLDDSHTIVPRAHMWVKSKQPWVKIPDDVIVYDTQPETQEEWTPILFPDATK